MEWTNPGLQLPGCFQRRALEDVRQVHPEDRFFSEKTVDELVHVQDVGLVGGACGELAPVSKQRLKVRVDILCAAHEPEVECAQGADVFKVSLFNVGYDNVLVRLNLKEFQDEAEEGCWFRSSVDDAAHKLELHSLFQQRLSCGGA